MKRLTFVAVAAAFVLGGCATSTLTEQDAGAYATISVAQFTKARFWGDRPSRSSGPDIDTYLKSLPEKANRAAAQGAAASSYAGFGASMAASARAQSSAAEAIRIRTAMFDDDSILLDAPFSRANDSQLYRPKTEYAHYCKAQGGALSPVGAKTITNPVAGAQTRAIWRDVLSRGAYDSRYFVGFTADDRKVVETAKAAAAFGHFVCLASGDRRLWEIVIAPTRYEPKDCTSMGCSMIPASLEIALVPLP